MKNMLEIRKWPAVGLTIVLVAFASGALAQSDDAQADRAKDRVQDATQNREGTRDQTRDGDLQQARDRTRDQLRTRIDAAPGLTSEERQQMHNNLEACLALDMPASDLPAIFPDQGEAKTHRLSAAAMLRLQDRAMAAARDGVAVEPMLSKVQEGRTKGVGEPMLEQACYRMEQYTRAAKRIMDGAAQEGIEPPRDRTQLRHMQGEIAQQMWRGMNEESYDELREHAHKRLRDGSCNATDLVAAGEVATRLQEAGVGHDRCLRFVNDAIDRGYREPEMRQIQMMVAARHHRGETMDDFLGEMERYVGAGMGPGEMYGYMMRHGWMGPGDMYGPGGHQAGDTKGFGGGHDGGGHHGGGGNDDGGGHGHGGGGM